MAWQWCPGTPAPLPNANFEQIAIMTDMRIDTILYLQNRAMA
jgi:hypothetical protein